MKIKHIDIKNLTYIKAIRYKNIIFCTKIFEEFRNFYVYTFFVLCTISIIEGKYNFIPTCYYIN